MLLGNTKVEKYYAKCKLPVPPVVAVSASELADFGWLRFSGRGEESARFTTRFGYALSVKLADLESFVAEGNA